MIKICKIFIKSYEKIFVCFNLYLISFENYKYYIFWEKIFFIVFEIRNIKFCNLKLKLVILKKKYMMVWFEVF